MFKAVFVLELFFCLDFLVVQKNGLIRWQNLISKFMTSQAGQQIITTNILDNIVSKGNQAMKFGQQFIKFIVRKHFCHKPYR